MLEEIIKGILMGRTSSMQSENETQYLVAEHNINGALCNRGRVWKHKLDLPDLIDGAELTFQSI